MNQSKVLKFAIIIVCIVVILIVTIFILGKKNEYEVINSVNTKANSQVTSLQAKNDILALDSAIQEYIATSKSLPESLAVLKTRSNIKDEFYTDDSGSMHNYELLPLGCKYNECTRYRVYTTTSDGELIEKSGSL